MGKSIIGVDIGTESIRAVEVAGARTAKPVITRSLEIDLPVGAVKSGEVAEANTVAAVLKQLWSTAGFTSKDVVLGVGNPKVLVRDLTLQKQKQKDMRNSLPFQVQEMLPVPVSEAILDFYPIAEIESDNGPVVRGLLVAAVKDSVNANIRAVQLAGLNPVEVDIIPFALNRIHVRGRQKAGTSALIDIGAGTTNVVIVRDGVPQFVRIIPAGSNDVTRALMGRLNITVEQAELGKRQLGLNTDGVAPEHSEASEIVREVTYDLLNSLRNTLSFYANAHSSDQIGRIFLSGGGAQMRLFREALSDVTRIPVEIPDPFESVPVGRTLGEAQRKSSHRMSVALGLALGSAA